MTRPKILTVDQVLEMPIPDPLVHGILSKGDLAMVYGAPGSGKSFLVLDLALSVATGSTWAGHATTKGTVVYCTLEGLAGFRRRIPAAFKGSIPDEVRDRRVECRYCREPVPRGRDAPDVRSRA